MRRLINYTDARVDLVDENGEVLGYEPLFKTPYNHDRNAESDRTSLVTLDPHLTDQSFKDEVDINTIIDRVKKTGQVEVPLPEHFGEDRRVDLFTARTRIAENNATFYNLDPAVRAEFLNDPGRWETQVLKDLDAGNLENLKRMGLDLSELRVMGYKPPEAAQGGSPAPGTPAPEGGAPAPSPGDKKPPKGGD